jgi:hypothetical protein
MGEELDGLVLRYEYRDTDGTGVLGAEARFAGFAGASSAWFSDEDLLGFADQLTTYPLGDSEFSLSGGYGLDEDYEERVGLTVRAVGLRGQVGVMAHLATPAEHPTYPGSSMSEVRIEVLTSYEALGQFSAELKRLVAGTADEAQLDAQVLG